MKKSLLLLVLLLALLPCAALSSGEYAPGTLMQPPKEVLDHLSRSYSSYELEDYCEIHDTPGGDYGFALLKAGDERLLVGYEEKNGKMSYWLKNHGAVMQGEEEAWFDVIPKGKTLYNEKAEPYEADGLSFTITQLDDVGESYEKFIGYHWENGGFKLTRYHDWDAFYGGVTVEDGMLHFHNSASQPGALLQRKQIMGVDLMGRIACLKTIVFRYGDSGQS